MRLDSRLRTVSLDGQNSYVVEQAEAVSTAVHGTGGRWSWFFSRGTPGSTSCKLETAPRHLTGSKGAVQIATWRCWEAEVATVVHAESYRLGVHMQLSAV